MPREKSSLYFSLGIVAFVRILFAKHNLSSFKFSTEYGERTMLVNTPILEVYLLFHHLRLKTIYNLK